MTEVDARMVARYSLYILNFVICILSMIMILFGAIYLAGVQTFNQTMGGLMVSEPAVVIVVGCLLVIMTIVGCVAVDKEYKNILYGYAWVACFLVTSQLVFVMVLAIKKEDMKAETDAKILEIMKGYHRSKVSKEFIDTLQDIISCCGIRNYTDWTTHIFKKDKKVVSSCCKKESCNVTYVPPIIDEKKLPFHSMGCTRKIGKMISSKSRSIMKAFAGLVVLEFICIIITVYYASSIPSK